MVLIEMDDEVWDLYKKSWALLGTKTHEGLISMLEVELREESNDCIESCKNSRE